MTTPTVIKGIKLEVKELSGYEVEAGEFGTTHPIYCCLSMKIEKDIDFSIETQSDSADEGSAILF